MYILYYLNKYCFVYIRILNNNSSIYFEVFNQIKMSIECICTIHFSLVLKFV